MTDIGNSIGNIIKKPVGNNLENEPEDKQKIRGIFEEVDIIGQDKKERDIHDRSLGYITRVLDDGIEDFQKKNDLKINGCHQHRR